MCLALVCMYSRTDRRAVASPVHIPKRDSTSKVCVRLPSCRAYSAARILQNSIEILGTKFYAPIYAVTSCRRPRSCHSHGRLRAENRTCATSSWLRRQARVESMRFTMGSGADVGAPWLKLLYGRASSSERRVGRCGKELWHGIVERSEEEQRSWAS